MKPATWPRDDVDRERLLCVDPTTGTLTDRTFADLPSLLRAGDVLVVNDAATLPASLHGRTSHGEEIEARLWQHLGGSRFEALLFGPGDARMRTEDRPLPPLLNVGSKLRFQIQSQPQPQPQHRTSSQLAILEARVVKVGPSSARLVTLDFDRDGIDLYRALYAVGAPIQYSYVERPYALWHVQTRFAAAPVAAEMPSAGRPLSWQTLLELRRRGVTVVALTHAAGLSSTGDPALDALLPLPERWTLPAETAAAIDTAKREGRRIVAVGTSVVRALESAARDGMLRAGTGTTDLVISPSHHLRVVDLLLTGVHSPEESHFALLSAFAPRPLLERALAHADAHAYLTHEMGDSMLIGDTHPAANGLKS